MDYDPITHTLNPTCTGTSVFALEYDGGIAILTDRVVSYGKTARYKGISRQYRVNSHCVIAFSGDHADFQWLQNLIERRQEELRCCNRSLKLTPKMLHSYLTTFLYYRRCKMNPIWNTLVVAGLQPVDSGFDSFIGIITQRGVSYVTKSVATGIGAMILNQMMETELKESNGKLSRDDALKILRKCLEITIYQDCLSDPNFEISTIEATDGVVFLPTEKIIGNWEIAEKNNQFY